MKKILIYVLILAAAVSVFALELDKSAQPKLTMPHDMKGSTGMEQAKVLTVYAAEEGGARFRAYHVKWKGQDVIVSDMLGTSDFKEGDSITFMVLNSETPAAGRKLKMLNFMIDPSTFMPKNKSSNRPSEANQPKSALPPGMKARDETEQAKVLTVYAVEEGGARFRAYHVKWQNQDVIVSDMFGTTDFKKGDSITFMVQNIEVPFAGRKLRRLNFMIIDPSVFMPKSESSTPSEQTP